VKIFSLKKSKGEIVEKVEMLSDEMSNKAIYQFMQEAVSRILASNEPIDLNHELDRLFDQRLSEFKKRDEELKTKITEYLKNIKSYKGE
jgi:hypothetical protein